MATDWKTEFNNLCKEIEILEIRAKDLEYQLKHAYNRKFGGCFKSDGHTIHIPLDKALEKYDDAKDRLLEVVNLLDHKKQVKQQMESRINEFDGIEQKVMVMRDIQRLSLREIADRLGYSYDWVKKLSSRTQSLYKVNTKKGVITTRIS